MYKLCKTEQSARRQRKIEDCLLDIMRTKNFDDITITELCERMKMPRKAFYRYFDSKEDTLIALIDHHLSEYRGFSLDRSNDNNRSLANELEEYFVFWKERRELLLVLDRSGLLGVLTQRIINYPLQDRILTARFLPDDNENAREMIFKFALSGLMNTMICWYRDDFNISTREMSEIACRMLREPLFPNLNKLGIQ